MSKRKEKPRASLEMPFVEGFRFVTKRLRNGRIIVVRVESNDGRFYMRPGKRYRRPDGEWEVPITGRVYRSRAKRFL